MAPLGPPGEAWPTWDSKPLLFVCQMNLSTAPAVPPFAGSEPTHLGCWSKKRRWMTMNDPRSDEILDIIAKETGVDRPRLTANALPGWQGRGNGNAEKKRGDVIGKMQIFRGA